MINCRPIAADSLHLWTREIKMAKRPTRFHTGNISTVYVIARPQLIGRAQLSTESGGTAASDRNEEKNGVAITKEDIVCWANRLHKDGKHEHALEIFDWLDGKKMKLSPSELELYVEILAKTKGLRTAQNYFWKVDPCFNEHDPDAKNWPAYAKIMRLTWEGYKKIGIRPLTWAIPE